MIQFFLVLVTLQSQPQTEQQLQQLRQELQQQRQQFGRFLELLEQQEQKRAERRFCSAEIRSVNSNTQRRVPLNIAATVPLSLFSVVTKPQGDCLQAEIRVTANYLDTNDSLVCSGVIENVAIQNTLTQTINLDIRPWNLREFVRWRNEPSPINSGAKRLVCVSADGLTEVTSEELERVTSIKVNATVLPRGGGLSTAEIQLSR